MLSSGLPISRYVNVAVSLTTPGIIAPAINSLMIIGSSDVIDAGERARNYANISEVASDFGTDTEEFKSAEMWFSQNPRPDNVFIGRWIQSPTSGGLVCGILNAEEQSLAVWTAITDGSFKVSIDGAAATDVSGLDFSNETNLNGVASKINAALTGADVVWNGDNFAFKTTSTGTTASMSFLQPGTAGTDISTMMRGTAATGARGVPGAVAETAVSALATI
ncbi:MAG TPA: DUF3383 family protein, partial [Pyrinomonadaceae bacterium]